MHAELSNLWLFAQLLGKVSVTTGIGFGILLAYAAEKLASVDRVTARSRSWNVVSIEDGRKDKAA